ncbi:MAG TPA: glycerol kinase GlpK [Candidatus Acidoferrum sp.]|nr:glycerol kinase GlpK [Candidatus Acidoferrum sp.]
MPDYVGAIDQGTTSTRFIVFDRDARVVAVAQREHQQIYPRAGWVEHDAEEIWTRTQEVLQAALTEAKLRANDLAAIGITNQRETTVIWDRRTGRSIANAIMWQDTRTAGLVDELSRDGGQHRFRASTGLPLATYFSGPKICWMLDHVSGLRERAENRDVLFGTIDSFLLWRLTGGVQAGIHATDVTNASRTQLMNIRTLQWDRQILAALRIPAAILPQIRSSSEIYGEAKCAPIEGVPIAAMLGDQQAALVGQACFEVGEAKNTYGTGCFLLMGTGEAPVESTHGLITTVGYKFGEQPAKYALEGSIAITGALVQWLRDNLGLIERSADIERLAQTVVDNGGVYFVPAFSGLFAPHWKPDARGVIVGLTRYANKGHIARAVLEATAFQVREVVEATEKDSKIALGILRVDGGMAANDLLMQIQADILDRTVVRSAIQETTALGAAFAAGLGVGFFTGTDEIRSLWKAGKRFEPKMDATQREQLYKSWQKAVTRSFDWVD